MSEEKKKLNKKLIIKNLMPIIVFLVIGVILTLVFLPEIKELGTDEGREEFKAFIDSLGIFGWLIGLGISILQTVIALIPGEPIELLMGFVFGPWLGTFICLLASAISATAIFFIVRRFGMPFIKRAVGEEDLSQFKFLANERRLEVAVLILFLVPATPKDILLYIVPLANISYLRYILLTTFARIPSVITLTVLGGSVAEGEYLFAVIVFAVTAVVALVGVFFGNYYVKKKNSKKEIGEQGEENSEERGEESQ